MNLDQRQTGRSTRTRDRAIELADRGCAVYLLVQTKNMVKPTEAMLDRTWGRLYGERRGHGIKVEHFDHNWADQWDWEKMQPTSRFHSNCEFLLDHTVIEARISALQIRMKEIAAQAAALYQLTV